MTESFIALSVAGFVAGFVFSMPIAGPISILITSNALQGRMRYCVLATLGASFADFIYVFVAVFGVTRLYALYQPFMPYVLVGGAGFLLYLGGTIAKTDFAMQPAAETSRLPGTRTWGRGGLLAGFLLNMLNPTLFMGWLTSSLFVISMVASLGFDAGGLDGTIGRNVRQLNGSAETAPDARRGASPEAGPVLAAETTDRTPEGETARPSYYPLLISALYAFFLSLGSIVWFLGLARCLVKYRTRLDVRLLGRVVRGLGVVLCLFGVYLGYTAIAMLV